MIAELVAAIPADKLPPHACVADLAIAREREISTNLGFGVAIPHARCEFLTAPLIVVGRSSEGVVFSPQDPQAVRPRLSVCGPRRPTRPATVAPGATGPPGRQRRSPRQTAACDV